MYYIYYGDNMNSRQIIKNLIKTIVSLLLLISYIFMITKFSNIKIYKSFVLLMILVLIIYFVFRLINKFMLIEKQLVVKLIEKKEGNNIVIITYQYLNELYYYEVDANEYDQNKYFKYRLEDWYSVITKGNKVIKLLDPATAPVIDKKILEKHSNKKLKYNIHNYIYYIFEFLFVINIILFPLEIVLTNYKINIYIFIIIEVINIILFVINSKILKKINL